jgi:hypothetical protein
MATNPKQPKPKRASKSPVETTAAASPAQEPIRPAAQKPKKVARKKTPTRKKTVGTCFVISPFGGWHDDYHREIFCSAIQGAGLEPTRADDLFRSSNIVHDIWHFVSSSRVMLADLTGKNPNVFYELGLAHAARKPVLLVTQTMDDVPFDLRALRVITYDVQHPSWGDLLRENIETGLRETLKAPEGSVLPTFLLESPSGQTKVSRDEKRFLELQQQVESLRSQVRTLGRVRSRPDRSDLDEPEAAALLRTLIAQDAPEDFIVEHLSSRGVPAGWVRQRLKEQGYSRGRRISA